MQPHPRIRKTVKWGGAVFSAALAVAWIGSSWWHVVWWDGGGHEIRLGRGGLFVGAWGSPDWKFGLGHWQVERRTEAFAWWFEQCAWGMSFGWTSPLWVFLFGVVGLTALVWRLDTIAHRARVGFCPKCSYDRCGLPAGAPCPECGKAVPAATAPTM